MKIKVAPALIYYRDVEFQNIEYRRKYDVSICFQDSFSFFPWPLYSYIISMVKSSQAEWIIVFNDKFNELSSSFTQTHLDFYLHALVL